MKKFLIALLILIIPSLGFAQWDSTGGGLTSTTIGTLPGASGSAAFLKKPLPGGGSAGGGEIFGLWRAPVVVPALGASVASQHQTAMHDGSAAN